MFLDPPKCTQYSPECVQNIFSTRVSVSGKGRDVELGAVRACDRASQRAPV